MKLFLTFFDLTPFPPSSLSLFLPSLPLPPPLHTHVLHPLLPSPPPYTPPLLPLAGPPSAGPAKISLFLSSPSPRSSRLPPPSHPLPKPTLRRRRKKKKHNEKLKKKLAREARKIEFFWTPPRTPSSWTLPWTLPHQVVAELGQSIFGQCGVCVCVCGVV